VNKIERDRAGRRKRRQFSNQQKQGWVERFHKEGSAALEFARKHRLTYSAFLKWTKRFGNGGALLPVQVVRPTVSPARPDRSVMEVHLSNGRKVCLSPGFDGGSVRELIGLLEETC
jgi:transposase-like protein